MGVANELTVEGEVPPARSREQLDFVDELVCSSCRNYMEERAFIEWFSNFLVISQKPLCSIFCRKLIGCSLNVDDSLASRCASIASELFLLQAGWTVIRRIDDSIQALRALEHRRLALAIPAVVTFWLDVEALDSIDDILCSTGAEVAFNPSSCGILTVFLRHMCLKVFFSLRWRGIIGPEAEATFSSSTHDSDGSWILT